MQPTIHTRDYAWLGGTWDPEVIAAILTPIAGDHPAGEWLRLEGTYDRIAEARREEDDRLEQGVWQKELKRADWVSVAQMCGEALELRSKDLQLAAWLTEAWCRLHGFLGLRAGLEVIQALCGQYWADLYPSLEDIEHRAAPFHWINEKLAQQLQFIPLTQPSEAEPRPFTWADWEQASLQEQERLRHGSKNAGEETTPARVQQALRLTTPAFVAANLVEIERAGVLAADLESFLDGQIAAAGPSLRQLRVRLDEIAHWLGERPVTALAAAAAAAPMPAPGGAPGAMQSSPNVSLPATGSNVRSREEAYAMLAEAAAYLARTEPHSPTPYLVHRAIRWGSLPLDQLLPELIRNDGALHELQQLLNLKKNATRD